MTLDKIYANLEPVAELGCLVWTRSTNTKGYGLVWFHKKLKSVHRVIWEHVHGPISPGIQIDHLCRVRSCANVDHLELVTPRENILRGESLSAQRARQTHCKQGHALSGDNLCKPRPSRPTYRRCRTCHLAQKRRYRAAAHTIQESS